MRTLGIFQVYKITNTELNVSNEINSNEMMHNLG